MAMKRKNLPEVVPELFEHEQFGNFRYIKRGEEILFVGVDLCRALGYTNPQKALRDHVPDKYKNTVTIRSGIPNELGERIVRSGQRRKVIVVSEPGLYRLIMRSNLPAAEKFMDQVCEEVLPSIRKYGYYGVLPLAITNKDGKVLLNLPSELYDKNKSDFVNMMNIFAYIEKEQKNPAEAGKIYPKDQR